VTTYQNPKERRENAEHVTRRRWLRRLAYIPGLHTQFTKVSTPSEVLAAVRELRDKGMSECWMWTGQNQKVTNTPKKYGDVKTYGYPVFKERDEQGRDKYVSAKRYAFELINGNKLKPHEIIKNVCGENCINPSPKHNIISSRESWRADMDEVASQQVVKTDKTPEELLIASKQREHQTVVAISSEESKVDGDVVEVVPPRTVEDLQALTVFQNEWEEPADTPTKVPTEAEFLKGDKA
jgi:hypothetical protein